MSTNARLFVNVLYLSFPVWGLVLFFGVISVVPGAGASEALTVVGIALGMLAPFLGAIPIFRMPDGAIVKAVFFVLYYAVCAVAMFFVGWWAIMAFGIAR